jgi:hypothetical protein
MSQWASSCWFDHEAPTDLQCAGTLRRAGALRRIGRAPGIANLEAPSFDRRADNGMASAMPRAETSRAGLDGRECELW